MQVEARLVEHHRMTIRATSADDLAYVRATCTTLDILARDRLGRPTSRARCVDGARSAFPDVFAGDPT